MDLGPKAHISKGRFSSEKPGNWYSMPMLKSLEGSPMRLVLASLSILLAVPGARAGETLPAFGFVSAARLKENPSPAPAVSPRPQDVIAAGHLLLQAGKTQVFGYAETEAQYAEALSYWSAALRSAGIEVGKSSFKNGLYAIAYKTADGRVIRDFLADPKLFPPKDEAGLRANMALSAGALHSAGLTVLAANVVNLDFMLPTYSLLYLTTPQEDPARETRLRMLAPGEDIDFDLLESAGVRVLQKPRSWIMVYIGQEIGFISRVAKTREQAEQKLRERADYLAGQGKRIIGSRIHPLDDAEYKFLVNLYFYQ